MNILLVGCEQPDLLKIIYVIKRAIEISFIVLPIALIVMMMVDLVKSISYNTNIRTNSNDNISYGMSKGIRMAVKRLLIAVFLFFIPSIVSIVFNLLETTDLSYAECWDMATKENIDYYEKLEQKEIETTESLNIQNQKQKLEDALSKMEKEQKLYYLNGKGKVTNATIFVGDSRMFELCHKLSASSLMADNEQCVAKGSEAYNWFVDTAISEIDNIMKANPSYIYNIVINLGINDLTYKPEAMEYIKKYNELKEGKWAKHNLIIVSVDPTDPNKFSTTSFYEKIATFNSYLKDGLNKTIYYCNTYNIVDNLIKNDSSATADGLHYTTETYQIIYELMKSCIKSFEN